MQSIYHKMFIWADFALFFFFPATFITVLNSVIIYKICHVRRHHCKSSIKQRNAVVMLFAVSMAYIFLTTPITVRDLYYLLNHQLLHNSGLLHYVPYTMWLFNYAINFYLYSLAGSKVRNVLFGYCVNKKQGRISTYSSKDCNIKF